MDYEKNKEALVIVKQMVADGQISQEVAEKYFPELKEENEDERIRKEIIDFVKSRGGFKGDWIAWLEKQGETSPILSNSPNTGKDAWSEEDEAVLDALIRMLEGEDVYVSPHLAVDCLKSLKDRVQPQPKQEWSEEDENMINSIIRELIHQYNEEIPQGTEDKIKWLKNWLKSLRPQNRWKPSDGQIKALEDTFVALGGYDNNLRSLINDLKSLKA